MIFTKTKLKDLYIIKSEPFQDERGEFSRLFCINEFKKINFNKQIMQINHSYTLLKGAIRGMHFQNPPKTETKIVKCLYGKVFDVAIDIRKNSQTFLQWHGEILSEENMKMIYIPDGFAHGFQTLEEESELLYFHSNFYDKDYEDGIRYNDPRINIKWPLEITYISKRDKDFLLLDESFKGLEV